MISDGSGTHKEEQALGPITPLYPQVRLYAFEYRRKPVGDN